MLWELVSSVQRTLLLIGTVYLIFAIAIATILAIVTFFMARICAIFVQFRGAREVICPETGNLAVVLIDALHAAVSSAVADPELRVKGCSRWPERQGCRQECVLRNRV